MVQQRTADKIAERAGKLSLESLTLEQLTSERFGLSKGVASRIVRARDAHELKSTTDLRSAIQLDAGKHTEAELTLTRAVESCPAAQPGQFVHILPTRIGRPWRSISTT